MTGQPPIDPGEHVKQFLSWYVGLTMNRIESPACQSPPDHRHHPPHARYQRGNRRFVQHGTSVRRPRMRLNFQKRHEMEVGQDRFEALIEKEIQPAAQTDPNAGAPPAL
jgi:hypothetical protein